MYEKFIGIINSIQECYCNKIIFFLKSKGYNENDINEQAIADIATAVTYMQISNVLEQDIKEQLLKETGNIDVVTVIENAILNNTQESWELLINYLNNQKENELLLALYTFKNNLTTLKASIDGDKELYKFINTRLSKQIKLNEANNTIPDDKTLSDFYDTFSNHIFTMFCENNIYDDNEFLIVYKKINLDKRK